jgi:hypothetical protein
MTALLLTFGVLFIISMYFYIFAEEQQEKPTFTKRELRELVENGFYDDYFSSN